MGTQPSTGSHHLLGSGSRSGDARSVGMRSDRRRSGWVDDRERLRMPGLALSNSSLPLSLLIDPPTLVSSIRNDRRIPLGDDLELRSALMMNRPFPGRNFLLLALKQRLDSVFTGQLVIALGFVHVVSDLDELLVDVLEAGGDSVGDGL